jgi:tetratricopeptide (TPR) repeat protein
VLVCSALFSILLDTLLSIAFACCLTDRLLEYPSIFEADLKGKHTGGSILKKLSLRSAPLALIVIISSLSLAGLAQPRQPATQGKPDGSTKKGDDLYKAGKFKEAIEAYKEALNQDPNNDQAVAYIGYSYNKLHDTEQARVWMKRRVDLPGQSPSKKAQVLTDVTLLYWDEAHLDIAARLASSNKNLKPEDVAGVRKLLGEGIDSALKAVAIAPRSVKGFNLLNLLYRASAVIETDQAAKTDLLAKADEALRKSIQFYEAIPQQQSADIWVVPTLSTINGTELGPAAHFGAPTKKSSPDVLKGAREGSVIVEVVVGRDGKVRLQRVLAGQGKPGDIALGSAQQWEFQPSTFEGHTVQVIETISFPAK